MRSQTNLAMYACVWRGGGGGGGGARHTRRRAYSVDPIRWEKSIGNFHRNARVPYEPKRKKKKKSRWKHGKIRVLMDCVMSVSGICWARVYLLSGGLRFSICSFFFEITYIQQVLCVGAGGTSDVCVYLGNHLFMNVLLNHICRVRMNGRTAINQFLPFHIHACVAHHSSVSTAVSPGCQPFSLKIKFDFYSRYTAERIQFPINI